MARQRRPRTNRVKYWAVVKVIRDSGECDDSGNILYQERWLHWLPYKTAARATEIGLRNLIRKYRDHPVKRDEFIDAHVMVMNVDVRAEAR